MTPLSLLLRFHKFGATAFELIIPGLHYIATHCSNGIWDFYQKDNERAICAVCSVCKVMLTLTQELIEDYTNQIDFKCLCDEPKPPIFPEDPIFAQLRERAEILRKAMEQTP